MCVFSLVGGGGGEGDEGTISRQCSVSHRVISTDFLFTPLVLKKKLFNLRIRINSSCRLIYINVYITNYIKNSKISTNSHWKKRLISVWNFFFHCPFIQVLQSCVLMAHRQVHTKAAGVRSSSNQKWAREGCEVPP